MIKKNRLVFFILLAICVPVLVTWAHGAEHIIIMTDEKYEPINLTIEQGETVIFKNEGKDDRWPASSIHPTHRIYPEFDSKTPILQGDSWSFTFDKAGIWRWHDHLDPSMKGQIDVLSMGTKLQEPNQTSFIGRMTTTVWRKFKEVISGFFRSLWRQEQTIDEYSTAIFTDTVALTAYINEFGPDKAVVRLNELSTQFGSCHNIAHEAGRISYELFEERAFQKCNSYCHSGCYHGATEAYFKEHSTADLAKNLKILCNDELNSFFSHQCIHGIGHGLMAWTDYDLPNALKSCDLLEQGQSSCWTGVFMENIVGGLAKEISKVEQEKLAGHFTKYLNDDPQYPCTVVEEKYKSSCYFFQTSRMIQLFNNDFSKVAGACSETPQPYQRTCFESMGRDVGGAFYDKPDGVIKACSSAPAGEARISCLNGAVQNYFWDPTGQGMALAFCEFLTDGAEKTACYQVIFSRAPEILDSKNELISFCRKAEASYQAICTELTGT